MSQSQPTCREDGSLRPQVAVGGGGEGLGEALCTACEVPVGPLPWSVYLTGEISTAIGQARLSAHGALPALSPSKAGNSVGAQ